MDWLSDNLWSAWLAAAVVLAGAEMLSLDLVLIMLAVGAAAGMITALIGAPFLLQALVGAGAAVGMLAFVRPSMARRLHAGPTLTQGHDKLVGQRGVVTEELSGLASGRVRLGGEIWSAAPYDDTITIAPGQTVEVLQIRGATAYVHPVPTLEA
ncbi:MAG: NfeD family protein [Nocardioides sp.]